MKRGDIHEYTLGARRIRVLIITADSFTSRYPVIALIHDRADGNVPGILYPAHTPGGGTIDISRIRFADPTAFGTRIGQTPPALMDKIDNGLRRLLNL
jgi:mRNA-degrading endonuclease toxin of MazEF toxin-antitoxin module